MRKKGLGYPKSLWILAIGLMINVTGSSFIWPLVTIYISKVLGQTVTIAGLVLMLQAGAGMIGSLVGGSFYDRIGGRKTILVGTLFASLSVIIIAFVKLWLVYLGMMILLGFSTGMIFPAVYAMAGGVWPEGGQKAFNLMYISQNIGVALGSALGGIVAQFSFTVTFLVNGVTYLIFTALVWFGLTEDIARQPRGSITNRTQTGDRLSLHLSKEMTSLIMVSFGFLICWIGYVQWTTTISAHMNNMGFSLSSYSLLWTVNGLLIITLQPISMFLTSRFIPSVRRQLLIGVIILMSAFIFLSGQEQYYGFLIGMMITTIGEILVWPGVPAAAASLAPEGRSGFYQGMVNSFATGGRMVGPLIGGILYDLFSMKVMFFVMAMLCGVAFLSFYFYEYFSLNKPLIHRWKRAKTHP